MNDKLKTSLKLHCTELIARYKAEREALDDKIADVEQDLEDLDSEDESPVGSTSRQRMARGQNRRIVRSFFNENPDAVVSLKDVAQKTGLPTTSAIRALRQLAVKGFVEKTEDNQWKKKAESEEGSERQ